MFAYNLKLSLILCFAIVIYMHGLVGHLNYPTLMFDEAMIEDLLSYVSR